MTLPVTPRPRSILLVEDNPGDVDLVREAVSRFKSRPTLHVAPNGAIAIEMLTLAAEKHGGQLPDLILLDLNVPKVDGREILNIIKSDTDIRHVPVIVFSSSRAERDVLNAYRFYANCFITKPSDIDGLYAVFDAIEAFWFQVATLPADGGRGSDRS